MLCKEPDLALYALAAALLADAVDSREHIGADNKSPESIRPESIRPENISKVYTGRRTVHVVGRTIGRSGASA